MRIYIDTEFTNFIHPDVISIGLVAESGKSFYGENSEYRKSGMNQFVREVVLPLLKPVECAMPRYVLGARIRDWLKSFSEDIWICYDYYLDRALLHELIGDSIYIEDYVDTRLELYQYYDYICKQLRKDFDVEFYSSIKMRFKILFEGYFHKNPKEFRHHALADAMALLEAQSTCLKFIDQAFPVGIE